MVHINLFKFDSTKDYLPYYKNYSLEYIKGDTIHNILNKINDIENFSYIKDELFFLKVNNIFIESNTKIEVFSQNSSIELLIEPLSILRTTNDLVINTKDYTAKLNLLDNFLTPDEKHEIIKEKKFMLEYYASNTLNFNRDYIGDHVLLITAQIVQDKPQSNILKHINDKFDGVLNHTSLKYRILNYEKSENTIQSLLKIPQKKYQEYTFSSQIKQYFENFNISLYCSLNNTSFESVIAQSKAQYVELSSKHAQLALSTKNSAFTYLLAGNILLEAKDNNADFLIVNDDDELAIFDKKQAKISKAVGREIDFPVITTKQFIQLLKGEKNKTTLGFNKHKINIEFMD